ncbi:MAG: hypothetical protein HRU38_07795 [Saccharospirillaceae bacterium]|nr:hypothetical protein [Pseudomonadales bacterium]NRB78556.1 hypothetical protein [Saccharospirillaceae bacterium]
MNALFVASPLHIGIQGLKESMNRMSDHANNMQKAQVETHNKITNQDKVSVSQAASESQTLNGSLNIKQYSSDEQLIYTSLSGLEAKANAKVIQTGLDTLGTLINMKV